jgi:hypothetical protein
MVINRTNTKTILTLICIAGLFSLLLISCAKEPTNINTNPPVAAVSVTQATPDLAPINILIDNTQINQNTVNYGETSGYITLTTGTGSIVFYNAVNLKQILADTINFVQNTSYSAFLVNATTSKPAVFLLTDTLNKPAAGNAAIRFINLSPDAPAVDLVEKGGPVLVSNRSFEGYSSFAPIPGNTTYTFEVHQAGTSTVLASTNVKLNPAFIYTIWFHGLAAGTTSADKLSVDVITNTYFIN